MLTAPSATLVSSLPPRTALCRIEATSMRASVPSRRSSRTLEIPNCTVKKRKNTAMPAA
jgi:hypothetical protein